jgi:hypothetical protein
MFARKSGGYAHLVTDGPFAETKEHQIGLRAAGSLSEPAFLGVAVFRSSGA